MSKAFNDLISGNPVYLLCSYGRSHALGLRGTNEAITLAHNLFVNYYSSPSRPAPTLSWVSDDLAFINVTPTKLQECIRIYLQTNILHNKEVPCYSTWDGEKGEYNLVQDEPTAAQMATEEAATFVRDFVKAESFIPRTYSTDNSDTYNIFPFNNLATFEEAA